TTPPTPALIESTTLNLPSPTNSTTLPSSPKPTQPRIMAPVFLSASFLTAFSTLSCASFLSKSPACTPQATVPQYFSFSRCLAMASPQVLPVVIIPQSCPYVRRP